jgi:hypothetical protein
MATRGPDLAVAPRCRACNAELPRIVSDRSSTERKIELRCSACGTLASYVGPGLIVDRRSMASASASH